MGKGGRERGCTGLCHNNGQAKNDLFYVWRGVTKENTGKNHNVKTNKILGIN